MGVPWKSHLHRCWHLPSSIFLHYTHSIGILLVGEVGLEHKFLLADAHEHAHFVGLLVDPLDLVRSNLRKVPLLLHCGVGCRGLLAFRGWFARGGTLDELLKLRCEGLGSLRDDSFVPRLDLSLDLLNEAGEMTGQAPALLERLVQSLIDLDELGL